jgi:hypothetical protein
MFDFSGKVSKGQAAMAAIDVPLFSVACQIAGICSHSVQLAEEKAFRCIVVAS